MNELSSVCDLIHHPLDKKPPSRDDIFGCIFANEKFCILIKIPLNPVPIGNNPTLA